MVGRFYGEGRLAVPSQRTGVQPENLRTFGLGFRGSRARRSGTEDGGVEVAGCPAKWDGSEAPGCPGCSDGETWGRKRGT
jgi:hypothetical protein